jgi:hypothetical protein
MLTMWIQTETSIKQCSYAEYGYEPLDKTVNSKWVLYGVDQSTGMLSITAFVDGKPSQQKPKHVTIATFQDMQYAERAFDAVCQAIKDGDSVVEVETQGG